MNQVISFANYKGGVGKTTSAVNIASSLGEMGKRVLLIDLDPQGSAGLHFGVRDEGKAFLRALEKSIALPVLPTAATGVDLKNTTFRAGARRGSAPIPHRKRVGAASSAAVSRVRRETGRR